MSKNQLIARLDQMPNAKRIYRDNLADETLKIKNGVTFLVEITFESHGKISIKAAWVLDIIASRDYLQLKPILAVFCSHIHLLKIDSAKRPFAKIASILSTVNRTKKDLVLSTLQQEQLIETNFDWLTTKSDIAVKVYSMEALFQLGFSNLWVHEELKLILQKNISQQSPSYSSRGKKLLKSLLIVP